MVTGVRIRPNRNVFQHRHVGEGSDNLKGSGDSHAGNFKCWQPGERSFVEKNFPSSGLLKPGKHRKQRRFASAVGSDNRQYLFGRCRQTDLTDRSQSAKLYVDRSGR